MSLNANLDDLLGNLEMPEIDADLRSYQIKLKAVFPEGQDVPAYYEKNVNPAESAISNGCAVLDRSNWGR